jgi:hypothetical protein
MAWYFDTGTTSEDISNPECMSYLLALVVLHVCVKGFQIAHVQGIGMHRSAKIEVTKVEESYGVLQHTKYVQSIHLCVLTTLHS